MSRERGRLFVVSGPSGAGKSSVIRELLKSNPDIYFSVSATTRPPRENETEGVSYNFIDREKFLRMIEIGAFLEYAEYVGNCYGTPSGPVDAALEKGRDVLLDIDVQGAAKVKKARSDAVLVFIIPPSFAELERRLRERHTDSVEDIARRMGTALKEYGEALKYDYIVVNDEIGGAVLELNSIITAEKCRPIKRRNLLEGV